MDGGKKAAVLPLLLLAKRRQDGSLVILYAQ
jgi:hypothetical protein